MMLIRWLRHSAAVAAEVMVMPRSCSWTIQSMVAAPQRGAAVLADLHRDLVGGAADALRLHLEDRGDVAQRGVEDVERLLARGAADLLEGVVDDALADALLAAQHQAVDELRQAHVPVDRVGDDGALGDALSAGHGVARSSDV